MMLKKIENTVLYLLFLTLGTYAVPTLRYGTGESAIPYAVLFSSILVIVVATRLINERPSLYISGLLLFFTVVFLLSIVVPSTIAKFPITGMTVKLFLFAVTPLLFVCVCDRVKIVRRALLCLAITGFGVFIYGAYGYVTWEIGDLSQHLLGYFGVSYTTSTRNTDMIYLQSTFWVLFSKLMFGERTRMKPVYVAGVALLAIGMLLSLVRGTWITTSLTLMIIMVMGSRYRPRTRYAFAIFLVVLVVSLVAVNITLKPGQADLIVDRFASLSTLSLEGGNSNFARIELAGMFFGIIAEHPFGVGVANVRYYLVDFFLGPTNHAENVYLQLFAEQGFFGVAIFLLLLGWVLARLRHFICDMNLRPEDVWVGWALFGIVINWVFYGLFNSMVDCMWYWVVMSLAVSLSNITEYEMVRHWRKRHSLVLSSQCLDK